MTLPQRPLGSSGLPITVTGFGARAIGCGGWAFGAQTMKVGRSFMCADPHFASRSTTARQE